MKFFDWLKSLGKPKPAQDGGAVVRDTVQSSKQTAAEDARVPGFRRKLVRDQRYLPKPAKKNYWERPDPVLERVEAARAYSPSMRSRNEALRSLATDVELLRERRLPIWTRETELAEALAMPVKRLRWLANHRYDDRVEHYYRFRIPKRSGGYRVIMAPKTGLKAIQRSLYRLLTGRLPVSEHAHGFVPCRSVASNARPHVGKRVVMRFDLEDFFGTVTFGRVRGYFIAMGYNYEVATTLALLTTEAERQPVEVDGELSYVPVGYRYCAQGAPTSPSICNAIVMRMDRRLAGLAAAHGFAYTRYADDLTFSGDDQTKIGLFLRVVKEIVEDEDFRLNAKKTRVMRSGSCQRVTGVVVNETMGLSRKDRRKLRAQIHQMSADTSPAERAHVIGKLRYLQMLNPQQAAALWPGGPPAE